MTDAERRLWARLRSGRISAKFRRQEPIGSYIVDFACIERGLVIELDGSLHYTDEGKKRDEVRDAYLRSLGFMVLRFSDRDVMNNIEGVCQAILEQVQWKNEEKEESGK